MKKLFLNTINTREKSLWFYILVAFFIFSSMVYISVHLFDPDFYWHLKTGEWIWKNRELPSVDPFGIPPFQETPRSAFILTSYWLIQLILYSFYSLFGLKGILIFRSVIVAATVYYSAKWRGKVDSILVASLILWEVLFLEFYYIERPQFISFLFFGYILITLFCYLKSPSAESKFSLPLKLSIVMALWSNMHGGFIIGQAILIYFALSEGCKLFFRRSTLSQREYYHFAISISVALAASFINPNAINVIKYIPTIFNSKNYANLNVLEEMNILQYYSITRHPNTLFYFALMPAISIILFVSKKYKDITWFGIILGTMIMGSLHLRLMPFFLVASLLFFLKYNNLCTLKPKITFTILAVVISIISLKDDISLFSRKNFKGVVPEQMYPVKSVDYILSQKLKGNIFTTIFWGGYIIWKTGDDSKIFHDGRYLNLQHSWEYNNSMNYILNQERPYWKGLFNRYEITIAILPIYEMNGALNLLTQSIINDTENWQILFSAQNEVLVAKK